MGSRKRVVLIVNYRNSTYYKMTYKTTINGKIRFYIDGRSVKMETTHKTPTLINVYTGDRYYIFNRKDYEDKKLELIRK